MYNQKQELEELIRNYQTTGREHIYELKKFKAKKKYERLLLC